MDTERFEEAIRLRDSGRVREALNQLEALTASTLDPEEKATLLLNQSACYSLLGRPSEARLRLGSARRIAPKTDLMLYIEYEDATLHWHDGERIKALRAMNRLEDDYGQLLRKPEHRELYQQTRSSRGMLLTELERYEEARPLLEESLWFDPHAVEKDRVLGDLGLCLLQMGNPEGAEAKFESCVRERPEGIYATTSHYYLGTIFFKRGAFAKALSEFEYSLPGAREAKLPESHLYSYLASSARALGMSSDAERYEKLARA